MTVGEEVDSACGFDVLDAVGEEEEEGVSVGEVLGPLEGVEVSLEGEVDGESWGLQVGSPVGDVDNFTVGSMLERTVGDKLGRGEGEMVDGNWVEVEVGRKERLGDKVLGVTVLKKLGGRLGRRFGVRLVG
jgi:hypothetical protein